MRATLGDSVGGVYGTRAVRFSREAMAKSRALQKVIEGNELFKRQHTKTTTVFKGAHKDQSPQTRQIVKQMKT